MSAPSEANPFSGQYNLHQARALLELGHRVEVFVPAMWLPRALGALHPGVKRLSAVPERWSYQGVQMHSTRGAMLHPNLLRFKLWPRFPGVVASSVAWAHTRGLRRLLSGFKPDAMLVHEGALFGTAASQMAASLRVPWGVIEHDAVDFPVRSRGALWYAQTMRSARAVLGVAPPSVDRLREIGLTNVSLAPDGINPATDAQLAAPRPAELEGKKLVLCSGSPVPAKGHAELVRAFAKASVPGSMLVLVGPLPAGVDALMIELGITDRVKRLERMPAPEFQQWMAWADVFALPSHRESFGMVFAEALAAGTPVILTDACGIAPMLTHRMHGWIVPVGDVEQLSAALREALTSADLRGMGQNGRELVAGKLTWERSARAVVEALG